MFVFLLCWRADDKACRTIPLTGMTDRLMSELCNLLCFLEGVVSGDVGEQDNEESCCRRRLRGAGCNTINKVLACEH